MAQSSLLLLLLKITGMDIAPLSANSLKAKMFSENSNKHLEEMERSRVTSRLILVELCELVTATLFKFLELISQSLLPFLTVGISQSASTSDLLITYRQNGLTKSRIQSVGISLRLMKNMVNKVRIPRITATNSRDQSDPKFLRLPLIELR